MKHKRGIRHLNLTQTDRKAVAAHIRKLIKTTLLPERNTCNNK